MGFHVIGELLEFGGFRAFFHPGGEVLGVDRMFVRGNDEEVLDAALAQPVPAQFEQPAPVAQVLLGPGGPAGPVFEHALAGVEEPAIASEQNQDILRGGGAEPLVFPVVIPANEPVAEPEVVVEVVFDSGDEFPALGEASEVGPLGREAVFFRRGGVVELEEMVECGEPDQRQEQDNRQGVPRWAWSVGCGIGAHRAVRIGSR